MATTTSIIRITRTPLSQLSRGGLDRHLAMRQGISGPWPLSRRLRRAVRTVLPRNPYAYDPLARFGPPSPPCREQERARAQLRHVGHNARSVCQLGARLDGLGRLLHHGKVVALVVVFAVLRAILEFLLLRDRLRRDDLGKTLQSRGLKPYTKQC